MMYRPLGKVNTPAVKPESEPQAEIDRAADEYDDPLEFLKSVMNSRNEDIDTRKDAAKAMLPYIHSKKVRVVRKTPSRPQPKQSPASSPEWLHLNWLSVTGDSKCLNGLPLALTGPAGSLTVNLSSRHPFTGILASTRCPF